MKYLIVLLLLGITTTAYCQNNREQVFDLVEQMPQFPGGDDSMRHYLLYHIDYPEYSKNHHIEGRVDVRFTVNEDGHLSDIRVIRGQVPDINAEAVRVVRSFPNFTPGMHDSHPVKVTIILPIVFQLAENEAQRKKKK